jgi:hypothetical protein
VAGQDSGDLCMFDQERVADLFSSCDQSLSLLVRGANGTEAIRSDVDSTGLYELNTY